MAIIKATTSQFHVVPKEKHVRSECQPSREGLLGMACVCAAAYAAAAAEAAP